MRDPIPGAGLPLVQRITDTREFLGGWRSFFETRRERYRSNVFRTAVVFPAISILDVRGFDVLLDATKVRKRFGFGPAIPRRDLLAGVVPTVFRNDAPHDARKAFLLEWMALRGPELHRALDGAIDRGIARWAGLPTPFDWGAEADRLLAEFLFDWLLGTRPELEDVRTWFEAGFSPVPWDVPIPPAPRPAREARDRLLATIRGAPAFPEAAALGRSRGGMDDREVAAQFLFMLVANAWGGLQGAWRSLLAELSLHPEVAEAIAADPAGGMARGAVLETLRLRGPVPFAYGEARKDLRIESSSGSFPVRRGEMLMGVFWLAARDPDFFPDPERFDPTRPLDSDLARGLLWSNGTGDTPALPDNKVCAGKDIVPAVLERCVRRIVPAWQWTLASPPRWSDTDLPLGNRPVDPLLVTHFAPRGPRAPRSA